MRRPKKKRIRKKLARKRVPAQARYVFTTAVNPIDIEAMLLRYYRQRFVASFALCLA